MPIAPQDPPAPPAMPAPGDARTVLVSDRFPRPATVPKGARVLTPDARLAGVLRRAHATPAGEAGRDLVRAGFEPAGPYARWRALGAAVREVVGSGDLPAWRRTLAAPVRELLRAGATSEKAPAGASAATLRALAVADRYRVLLREAGAVDPAEAFRAAVAAGTSRRERAWAIVGVARWEAGFVRWLDAAAAPGSVAVLPPEASEAAHALAAAGWTVRTDDAPVRRSGERWARRLFGRDSAVPTPAPTPGPAALRFPSRDEQLRYVATETRRALNEGVAARDLAWIVRDPARLDGAVRALAWETGLPLRTRVERTLADTAVGGVAASLADAVARDAPYETTVRTLRHRCARPLADDAWAAARARRPEGATVWARFDPRCAAWSWPRRASAEATVDRFRTALEALLRDPADASPDDRLAREALFDALPELAALGSAETTPATFRADLDDLLRLTPLPEAPPESGADAAAVETLSYEAAAAGRWRRAWFLDLNEGIAPASVRDASVLDFADRARLRGAGADLDDAVRAARRETVAFAAALRAVDGSAVLCVPASGPDGARLPSPFLDAFLDAPASAPPPRDPVGHDERVRDALARAVAGGPHAADEAPDVLEHALRAWRVERRRESSAPPDRYDGVTGRAVDVARVAFSATSLTALGSCPFRWFASARLGLRELEERGAVLSPQLRGRLAHGTLERALRAAVAALRVDGARGADRGPFEAGPSECAGDDATGHDRLRRATLAAVPDAFAATERALDLPDGPTWQRARGAERRAVERLVRSEAFLTPGRWPVRFERPFEVEAFGLRLRGVVDRVDVGPDDAELVDYKLGASPPRGVPDRSGRGAHDLQLPLYLEVAAPEVVPERTNVRARYLSVRGAATVRALDPDGGDTDRAYLSALAAEARDRAARGAWPVRPDVRREACRTCDFGPVCRVGPRIDRKPAESVPERREP